MRKNFGRFFHAVIITLLMMSFAGCGYKTDPYYEAPKAKR